MRFHTPGELIGCSARICRANFDVEPPEVDQLARANDLGLVGGLRLLEHGRGRELPATVRPGEVGGTQGSPRPVRRTGGRPGVLASAVAADHRGGLGVFAVGQCAEDRTVVVRLDHVDARAGTHDVAAADDVRQVDRRRSQRPEAASGVCVPGERRAYSCTGSLVGDGTSVMASMVQNPAGMRGNPDSGQASRATAAAMRSSVAVSAMRVPARRGRRRTHRAPPGSRARQTRRRCRGTVRPGWPQVQSGLGVLDGEPGAAMAGSSSARPAGIALALFPLVGVVVERGDHGRLDGSGHHHAGVLAHGQQFTDQGASPATNPARYPASDEVFESECTAKQSCVVTVARTDAAPTPARRPRPTRT